MARYLKNTQLKGGSYSVQLPLGTSSLGPDNPVNAQIRFNQTNNKIEFYYNGTWNQIAKIGTVQLVVDTIGNGLTGSQNGSNPFFTMSQAETDPNAIAVFIGGVYQIPTTHYTVSSTLITFQSPPPAPDVNPNQIVVIHNLNSTNAA